MGIYGVSLLRQAAVNREENVVSHRDGTGPKSAVFLALQAAPLHCVGLMIREAVPEVDWKAFVQQELHAIFASNESSAS
jgi:hypothetical protein